MDLRKLRYFVAIAETHSLSKASERLNIAQPALSVQLAALEDELSAKLFERGSRGVTLTPKGAQLLTHARRILQSVNVAVDEIKTQDPSMSGHVTVGMPGTVAGVVTSAIIRQVRSKYPNILLRVIEDTNKALIRHVERNEVDVAIVLDQLESAGLQIVPVALESFCLLGPVDQSDGTFTTDWAALSGLPLLLTGSNNMSRKLVDQAARASGIQLIPVAEIDSTHLLKEAVLSGLGYAVLPGSACQEAERPSFWVRKILRPELQAVIAVVNLGAAPAPQQAVRATILEVCQALVDRGVWQPLTLKP